MVSLHMSEWNKTQEKLSDAFREGLASGDRVAFGTTRVKLSGLGLTSSPGAGRGKESPRHVP